MQVARNGDGTYLEVHPFQPSTTYRLPSWLTNTYTGINYNSAKFKKPKYAPQKRQKTRELAHTSSNDGWPLS